MKIYRYQRPIVIIFVLWVVAFTTMAYADTPWTDVTDKIQMDTSGLIGFPEANDTFVQVNLLNISQETLYAPFKIVLSNVEDDLVIIKNANGRTENGDIYFECEIASGILSPGQKIELQKWLVDLNYGDDFSYNVHIFSSTDISDYE